MGLGKWMTRLVLATALICSASASLFDDFVKRFNRNYESAKERAFREEVFNRNMAFANAENAKKLPYKLGMTQFADYTEEEYRALLTYRPRSSIKGVPAPLRTHGAPAATDSLPDMVDWTTKGAVGEVKDQGQCGSCWAFSATGALEGAAALKNGKLVTLSEEMLLDCDKKDSGCQGGLMDNAFQFVKANGLCSEKSYPYKCADSNSISCMTSVCAFHYSCDKVIQPGELRGYVDVTMNSAAALQSAVAQQPVSVAIEADTRVFQHYTGGVITDTGCGRSLDHGVLAVGYGTSESGIDYWKVKNSWGADWGMEGYVLIERSDRKDGSSCGILEEPSYPVLKSEDLKSIDDEPTIVV